MAKKSDPIGALLGVAISAVGSLVKKKKEEKDPEKSVTKTGRIIRNTGLLLTGAEITNHAAQTPVFDIPGLPAEYQQLMHGILLAVGAILTIYGQSKSVPAEPENPQK